MKVVFGAVLLAIVLTPSCGATLVPPVTNGSTYRGVVSQGMHDSECDYDALFCRTICGSTSGRELFVESYRLHLDGGLPGDVVTLRLVGLEAQGVPTTVDAEATPGADATADIHGTSCAAPHFEALGTHVTGVVAYTVVRS